MPDSRSDSERRAKSKRLLRTAFLIYGMMVAGLLAFSIHFPDTKPDGAHGSSPPLQNAAKAIRYEAVIANWNRYRAKDARAEAR